MGWQDIIVTPLFWVVSVTGTIVLSIVGNLLTPYTAAFITRQLDTRRTGLRGKQKKRRDQVIKLEEDIHRRTSTKLDAVFKLLLVLVILLGCVFLFLLRFSARRGTSLSEIWLVLPVPGVEALTLFVILFGMLFATVLLKMGLDDMSLALAADGRERARNDFLTKRGPASSDEIRQFEDEWDLKAFGVNSQTPGG